MSPAFVYALILTPLILLPVAWWVGRYNDRRDRRTDNDMRRGMRYLRERGEV